MKIAGGEIRVLRLNMDQPTGIRWHGISTGILLVSCSKFGGKCLLFGVVSAVKPAMQDIRAGKYPHYRYLSPADVYRDSSLLDGWYLTCPGCYPSLRRYAGSGNHRDQALTLLRVGYLQPARSSAVHSFLSIEAQKTDPWVRAIFSEIDLFSRFVSNA